ncbi:alpha/beta hydrolase [Variovorax sp. J22R133]|uniref:esterase/lipase family protein n=1 Tax=Variovorax brevis TaxID=3053503 RepID=UPI0025772413|nr:alpha/beta hydrolase [Variovorax sp. J22R133]MDM0115182.1 alpha/beta hydrolase [Variovorax sp. J22R133]
MASATTHDAEGDKLAPPSRLLLLAEWRALWELGAGIAAWPLLQLAPRGDGHPVLVLPGLAAGDASTGLLRRYLKSRGYDAHGWGLGRNLGPRKGVEQGMSSALRRLHDDSGAKVSLVGWSLGGVYARLLASRHPELVRNVITLGSPFVGHPRATNAWRLYEWVSGQKSDDARRRQHVSPTPPVPTTSIFSRSDGIVAWRSSIEKIGPQSENIEVIASHIGLGVHPAVLYALADRLAQPEGQWKPFNRQALALLYPDPGRAG